MRFVVDKQVAIIAAAALGRWWLDHPEGNLGKRQHEGLAVYELAVSRLTGLQTEPAPAPSSASVGGEDRTLAGIGA